MYGRPADVYLFEPPPIEELRHAIEAFDSLAAAAGRWVAFGRVQPLLARELAEEVSETGAVPPPGDRRPLGLADRLATFASLDPGRPRVLEAVDRTGSVSAAGRDLGVNYRRVWLLQRRNGEARAARHGCFRPQWDSPEGTQLHRKRRSVQPMHRRTQVTLVDRAAAGAA
ncbi:MAG: hypothetical protein JWN59_1384 [Sphingomonas bacterium]|nr:hypothetical protein [Sphingomonas bacterium]